MKNGVVLKNALIVIIQTTERGSFGRKLIASLR